MTLILAPLKRIIRSGDKGVDVKAVKRALVKAGYGSGIIITRTMGLTAVNRLKAFQKAHGLTADGLYGGTTHHALRPSFDQYGISLYNSYLNDQALAKARELLSFARGFDNGYFFGGEHDSTLSDDSVHGHFDCSSSTSFLLYHCGLYPLKFAEVSTWFEAYGDAGRGKYVTIHANADHVWTEFDLPEGYFRFDTSPHGDGPSGPRVRTLRRSDFGFVHRHPKGM